MLKPVMLALGPWAARSNLFSRAPQTPCQKSIVAISNVVENTGSSVVTLWGASLRIEQSGAGGLQLAMLLSRGRCDCFWERGQ